MAELFRTEINRGVTPARPEEFRALRYGDSLEIWPPVVLAPMAGVTNSAFRKLCREYGAGLYVSEMITARGIVEGSKKTRRLASFSEDEPIRSLQLYGSDPWALGEATRILMAEEAVDHLDLNFGCPVRKVTAAGGGAAIPAKPRLMARLVRAVVEHAGKVPVTIKVRLGIDETCETFLDSGRVAEEEGCAAIGLHARTAAELYDGHARWDHITRLKQAVHTIPVLGNGDLWECWDALRMMRETGCDGVIVGRGCLGRPWLFRELAEVFDGKEPTAPPNLGEILRVLERHSQLLVELFGPRLGMLELRKWCGWYLKGFPGSSKVRGALSKIHQWSDIEELIEDLDLAQPFPVTALRVRRAKRAGKQKVSLPPGYLQNRDDDQPPRSPQNEGERERLEKALGGG